MGAQCAGSESIAGRINLMICAISKKMTIQELNDLDLLYTPSVASVYDPILSLTGQAITKLESIR